MPRQRIPGRKEQLDIARSGRCLHCQGACGPEIWLKFQSLPAVGRLPTLLGFKRLAQRKNLMKNQINSAYIAGFV